VVEDVHIADVASAELLTHLARRIADDQWLIVVTRRTTPGAFVLGDDVEHVRVDLVPLDDISARAVLAIASDEFPLRPHETEQLAERAQGNPLFLLQLLHAARRTGSVDGLPDSVEGVITASIDRLPPVDRRLLRAAAVLGSPFEEQVLAELLDTSDLALDRLGEFVERLEGGTVAFRHALVRDTAYEGLPFSRRRELHARAGDVLERMYADRVEERADLLSLHFLQAERFDKAWQYARVASARAQSAYAYVEAARFYGHALTAARHLRDLPADELAGTWERLGDVRLRLGEFASAGAAFAEARKGFRGSAVPLARAQFRSAQVADLAADYPRALRWMSLARRTLASAHEDAAATLRAEISGFYGLIRHRQGRELDAVRWCERAVAEAEVAGAREALAAALVHLDVSETMLGRGDGSNTQRALKIWAELGDAWQEARAHNTLGIRAYFAGRWDEAVEHYESARLAATRAGDQWMATIASANVAEILSDQGRLAEAEPRLQEVLRTLRATGARGALSFGQGLYGRLLARSGRFAEALDQYAAARALQKADGEQTLLLETDVRIAECIAWQGAYGAALQAAGEVLVAIAGAPGASGLLPQAHRVHGLALAGLGDLGGAEAAVRAGIAAARERRAPHEVAWSLDVLLTVIDAAGAPDASVAAERDAIAGQLGIVDLARPKSPRERVVSLADDAVAGPTTIA
ncbi:MAG: hypothetical protein QOI42_1399, partial [Frankiaceae bacterium]|nr:hypothetical protein [Frankiaceae bacterium]